MATPDSRRNCVQLFSAFYGSRGTYEQYEPAYKYGYDLARDKRYQDWDWDWDKIAGLGETQCWRVGPNEKRNRVWLGKSA